LFTKTLHLIFRLSGNSPFLSDSNQETFSRILEVDYDFDEEDFEEISLDAKNFIEKLLIKRPE